MIGWLRKYRQQHDGALKISWLFISILIAYPANAQDYKIHQLANGLTLITAPSSLAPVVSMHVNFLAGSFLETKQTDGLVHLLEHMYFKSNSLVDSATALRSRFRELGMTFNGSTSVNQLNYYSIFPSTVVDDVVALKAAMAMSPKLDPQEIEVEKTVVIDEFNRWMNRVWLKPYLVTRKYLFGDLFHTTIPIGTTKKNIVRANAQILQQLRQQIMVPANTIIVLAGDIQHQPARRLIQQHFGDWKTPKDWQPPQSVTVKNYPPNTQRFNFSHPRSTDAHISILYRGPNAKTQTQDYLVGFLLSTLIAHKDGQFYKDLIQSGQWLYGGVGGGASFHLPTYSASIGVKADQVDQALSAYTNQLNLWLKPDYFKQDHLEDAQRQLVIGLKHTANNLSAYAHLLADCASIMHPGFYATLIPNYQKISLNDVALFIKKFLVNQPHIIAVQYNDQEAKTQNIHLNGDEYFIKHIKAYLAESDGDEVSTPQDNMSVSLKERGL